VKPRQRPTKQRSSAYSFTLARMRDALNVHNSREQVVHFDMLCTLLDSPHRARFAIVGGCASRSGSRALQPNIRVFVGSLRGAREGSERAPYHLQVGEAAGGAARQLQ
jgi:hypothetical protein